MPSDRKGALMRGLITLTVVAVAVGVAFWMGVPGFSFGGEESETKDLSAEHIQQLRNKSGCVVLIHSHEEDNEDSERTQTILKELKDERYEGLVEMGELDIEKLPEEAKKEGVTKENAPQLSFYIEGMRVGDYRGPWQKEPVQRKIDEVLRGYMQRIGKDWRPPVPGMERMTEGNPTGLEIQSGEE